MILKQKYFFGKPCRTTSLMQISFKSGLNTSKTSDYSLFLICILKRHILKTKTSVFIEIIQSQSTLHSTYNSFVQSTTMLLRSNTLLFSEKGIANWKYCQNSILLLIFLDSFFMQESDQILISNKGKFAAMGERPLWMCLRLRSHDASTF